MLKTQPRDKDLVRCLTQDHDLPLSVIAPYTVEHDLAAHGRVRRDPPWDQGRHDGLASQRRRAAHELARVSWEAATPLMGSSANVSLAGSKFRLADVEESVKQGSDFVLGYGTSKYINDHGIGGADHRAADVEGPALRGGLFEKQAEIVKKQFKVELTPRPEGGPADPDLTAAHRTTLRRAHPFPLSSRLEISPMSSLRSAFLALGLAAVALAAQAQQQITIRFPVEYSPDVAQGKADVDLIKASRRARRDASRSTSRPTVPPTRATTWCRR